MRGGPSSSWSAGPPLPAVAGDAALLLVFLLADQRFALPAAAVREVVRAVAITPLPGAPSVVAGAIDVRGEVLPVIDPCRRLGLPERRLEVDHQLIVAWAGERLVVLWVDRALELVEAPLAPLPAPVARGIAGLARQPDGLVVIADLGRFLDEDEARQLDAALGGSEVAE